MNNYIYLQETKFKVPLLAQDGVWEFTLLGREWTMPECMERLYIYLVIELKDYNAASEALRANDKHITVVEIDKFFRHLLISHPVKTEVPPSDIPIIATDERPLIVPNCMGYIANMSPTQEAEVLKIIEQGGCKCQEKLLSWFVGYVNRYGLTPRRKGDIDIQYADLATHFCMIHGINYYALSDEAVVNRKLANETRKERTIRLAKTGLYALRGSLICLGLLCWLLILGPEYDFSNLRPTAFASIMIYEFFIFLFYWWGGGGYIREGNSTRYIWTIGILYEFIFGLIIAFIGLFAVLFLDMFFSLARHF